MYTATIARARAAFLAVAGTVAVSGCATSPGAVSYSNDVRPILASSCTTCHAPGAPGHDATGFGVQDYEALMKGGKAGPVVQPGNPSSSRLVTLVEGRDPVHKMPHVEGMTLTPAQIKTIRQWIEQGAKNN